MKKRTIGSLLCSALLVLMIVSEGMGGQGERGGGGPRIQVVPELFNLGRIPIVKTSRLFLVRNIGNATLDIYHISTSCPCTQAFIDKNQIAPGKSTTMIVNYDPTIHAPPQTGRARREVRAIYIRSNDPETPEKTVRITAILTKP